LGSAHRLPRLLEHFQSENALKTKPDKASGQSGALSGIPGRLCLKNVADDLFRPIRGEAAYLLVCPEPGILALCVRSGVPEPEGAAFIKAERALQAGARFFAAYG
jgi:hypothetical protein